MPTELELIALNTEFDLYLPFSKRLVINLPDSKDRSRAALWLQKLRSIRDDNFKKLRNEHLKLLLFALHRRSLVGIFEKHPPKEELESFHDGHTLMEMTRELIEITEKKAQQGGDQELEPGECPLPKVMTNVSYDLKEYSAMQSIPKFGAHVYYAVSNEPIQMWKKSENGNYPGMGDIPNQLEWEHMMSKLSDHVLERQAALDERIALMKAIEAGDAHPDDLDDNIDFNKKIQVPICPPQVFKWKGDSVLRLHQNYDFSDVQEAENLEVQGTRQLETDEEAFTILDGNIPGRKTLLIRDPYFEGLPDDITERRYHGVEEDIPLWEDSSSSEEGDGCDNVEDLPELPSHDNCNICDSGRGSMNSERSSRKGSQSLTAIPSVSITDSRSASKTGSRSLIPEKQESTTSARKGSVPAARDQSNTFGRGYILENSHQENGMNNDHQFRGQSNQFSPQQINRSIQTQEQQNNLAQYSSQIQAQQSTDGCSCQPPPQIIDESCLPPKDKNTSSQSPVRQPQNICTCPASKARPISNNYGLAQPQQKMNSTLTPKQNNCCSPPPKQSNDRSMPPPKQNNDCCTAPPQQNNDRYVPPPQQNKDSFVPPPQQNNDIFVPPPQQNNDSFMPPPQQNNDSFVPPPQQNNDSFVLPPQQNNDSYSPPPKQNKSCLPAPKQNQNSCLPAPNQNYDSYAPAPNQNYNSYAPAPNQTYDSYSPVPNQIFDSYSPVPNQIFDSYAPTPNQNFNSYAPAPNQNFDSYAPVPNQNFDSYPLAPNQNYNSYVPAPNQNYNSYVPASNKNYKSYVPAPNQKALNQNYDTNAPAPKQNCVSFLPTPKQNNERYSSPPSSEQNECTISLLLSPEVNECTCLSPPQQNRVSRKPQQEHSVSRQPEKRNSGCTICPNQNGRSSSPQYGSFSQQNPMSPQYGNFSQQNSNQRVIENTYNNLDYGKNNC